MPTSGAPRTGARSQLWSTFVRNHAHAILACDFFVSVTATFQLVYVFVVLDVGTRRIVHWNATDHPTASWTSQQFRMVMAGDEPHRLVIHDHDSIYADSVDHTITAMGQRVLKTPVRSPQANAFCERVIGTIRRECLDWMIPLSERHLRRVFSSGLNTITADVRTRASGQVFLIRPTSGARHRRMATGSPRAIAFSPTPFSAASITSTVSRKSPHELWYGRREFLRRTGARSLTLLRHMPAP